MRITKENTVGLLIDIQEKLFPVMWEKETLLKNCKILLLGLEVLKALHHRSLELYFQRIY